VFSLLISLSLSLELSLSLDPWLTSVELHSPERIDPEKQDSSKPSGAIDLSKVETVEIDDSKSKKIAFFVSVPGRRYHLIAATENERQKWVEYIKKRIAKANCSKADQDLDVPKDQQQQQQQQAGSRQRSGAFAAIVKDVSPAHTKSSMMMIAIVSLVVLLIAILFYSLF